MNIKKVCLGLALMLPMICAPAALACGDDNYQGSYGNNGGNGGWRNQQASVQQNYGGRNGSGNWQRKMQRRMAWQQRQLAANDPNYNYWQQNPSQYQSLWQSQQNPNLVNQGVISPQEQALLNAQMQAYQQQMNGNVNPYGSYNDPYAAQNPYGYTNYSGGTAGNALNGLSGNGMSSPFISAAMPGILQRLAGYFGNQGGAGLGY